MGIFGTGTVTLIRVMKGNKTAFTCLGCWFDLADPDSMETLEHMLKGVTARGDLRMAAKEIHEAWLAVYNGKKDDLDEIMGK